MLEADRISHLLRRTGFGVRSTELRQALSDGYERTLERLLESLTETGFTASPPLDPLPNLVVPVTLLTFGRGVAWWLDRMVRTSSPLRERLTLFWHRHFATSGAKVFHPGWMFQQNLTLRRYACGPYSELLEAMMTDPALLRWLDADHNSIEHPNENLGRELLELFTVGRGNYDEEDVKELARLTTGQFDGPVHLLGQRSAQDFRSVLRRLAVHPSTAGRLVGELWEDLVAAPLPPVEKARLAKVWQRTRGNVSVVLREILRSPAFFQGWRQRVTSPVEYAVSCWRLLDKPRVGLADLDGFEGAGELLFFPPSVKGWDRGLCLIHPAAMQMRLEWACRWAEGLPDQHAVLQGLARTANPAAYLHAWSGGQVRASTVRPFLSRLGARDGLKLALSSPDLWTC
jgi:uncharacterized protein (DUF1800 family)